MLMKCTFICPHCGGNALEAVCYVIRTCDVDLDERGMPWVGDEKDYYDEKKPEWFCAACGEEFTADEIQKIVTPCYE